MWKFSESRARTAQENEEQNMLITESSDHLQCRFDARNDVLDPFIDKMTRLKTLS